MDTNHHLLHAHHSGLIIGTAIGALSVSVIAALIVVIVRPDMITHPTSFTSVISTQSQSVTQQSNQPAGAAAQNSLSMSSSNLIGPAVRLEE